MAMSNRERLMGSEPELVRIWLEEIGQSWSKIPELDIKDSDFKHLAIICDGNRRAAQQRGLEAFWGHRAGVEVIKGIMEAGGKWGIDNLTFWVWSTENWKRDQKQVSYVMDLATRAMGEKDLEKTFLEKQIRFVHLGRKDRLPPRLGQTIKSLEEKTAGFNQMTVNLAMDYGGIDEVSRAVIRLTQQATIGRFNLDDLIKDPNTILKFLDTGDQVKPDLVIRTGVKVGEIPHTSGFMPLQSDYAGWQFEKSLFPNLTPEQMKVSIEQFVNYERRMGK